MNDWRLLGLALAFVYAMARLQNVNRRAMKFGGLLVLALAGYKTVPLLAPMFTPVPERAAPRVIDVDTAPGEVGLESKFIGGAQSSARGTGDPRINIVPEAPIYDEVKVLSPTGDSLRVDGGEYNGTRSFDSVHIQVDTIDGDGLSLKADVKQGPVVTDTLVLASDSGAVLKTRTRFRNDIGWSAWGDSVQVTMVYPVPDKPTISSSVAISADSLDVTSSAFSSNGENDAQDSIHIQVEDVTGDWETPQSDVRLGAVLRDTATSLTADTTKARVRHKGRGGWSPWSDSVVVVMAGLAPNTPTLSAQTPTDTTAVLTGSAYSGSGAHTQAIYQVDSINHDWTSLDAADTLTSGDLELDTIQGLPVDAVLKARVAYSNANGQSDWSDSVTFTMSGLHPNEPTGMTVICNADGSVAESGGNGFGCTDFGGWDTPENVSTVTDNGNPTGSNSAVRFDWGTNGHAAKANLDLDASTAYGTIYVAKRVVIPTCWTGDTSGHKWFYIQPVGGAQPGDAVWTSHQKTDALWVMDGAQDKEVIILDAHIDREPDEILVEWVFGAESSPGAADGTVEVWVTSTNVDETASSSTVDMESGTSYTAAWGNLHYYMHANEAPLNCHIDVREFYVSGK